MSQGIYALIIENSQQMDLEVGKLGICRFPKGLYVYVGSAMGKTSTSLKNRIKRHLSKTKTVFWHIDYFLNSESTQIIVIIHAQTSEKRECALATSLTHYSDISILIPRFGASDCIGTCGAHLFYYQRDLPSLVKQVDAAFRALSLIPNQELVSLTMD